LKIFIPRKDLYNDDNGQAIKIDKKYVIAEKGQLFDVNLIGTGQSQGTYGITSAAIQANSDIRHSQFKGIEVDFEFIAGGRSAAMKSADSMQVSHSGNRNERLKGVEKEEKLALSSSNFSKPSKIANKMNKIGNHLRKLDDRSFNPSSINVTNINHEMLIGPDGFGNLVTNIATGSATNEGVLQTNDFQQHGQFKNSIGDLARISISTSNPIAG